jgi:SAM-dependent methyltransferase
MQPGALAPYEHSLLTQSPLSLCAADGRLIALDVQRWLDPVDDVDATVLDRCNGATLDVGCGPGRFVAGLADRGIPGLGVDIAKAAITLTRRRGVRALHATIFGPMPDEGRWSAVLLMDGNIGIGGDPHRLLGRVRTLLAPQGRLIVETHPDPHADEVLPMRLHQNGETLGPTFGWAQVGLLPLQRYACAHGYGAPEVWSAGGRTFAALPR